MLKINKLKPDELTKVNDYLTNPTAKFIKEYIGWKFSIGDVLIQKERDIYGQSNVVNVSSVCPVPKKFQVVHIDSLGIPWIKQISVSGGLGNSINPLSSYDWLKYQFLIDPMQMDAILLDHKYDPRIEYKNFRDRNPKYGRKDNETK